MPRIVASGGRRQAYDDFCTALKNGHYAAMLLVDSEDPVPVASPWMHLLQRSGDSWPTPEGTSDDDCHLMIQCMETWCLADRDALKAFFGQGFAARALPSEQTPVETIPKLAVYRALANATTACKTKAQYGKSEHSFLLLAQINPAKVAAASPWANRFVAELRTRMGA